MVQRNLTPGGDKNGADINLALDALEMAFTHDHINAFVIVGGDSDFITLVEKLKQYDTQGLRRRRPAVHQPDDAEELPRVHRLREPRRQQAQPPQRRAAAASRRPAAPATIAKALPLVKRALKVLSEREVSPQLGLLKSTLLQLDSTFSERDYGASTFRDFMEKVAQTGAVTLQECRPQHAGRVARGLATSTSHRRHAQRRARACAAPRRRPRRRARIAQMAGGGAGPVGPGRRGRGVAARRRR